jgi:hypothetical protein
MRNTAQHFLKNFIKKLDKSKKMYKNKHGTLLNFFWFNILQPAVESQGVGDLCSTAYAKISRRNFQCPGACSGDSSFK